jgi:hypothetical protein
MNKLKQVAMSDKTRQFLIILYGTLGAVALAAVFYQLVFGHKTLPADLSDALVRFLITLLGLLGPFIAAWLINHQAKQRSETTQRKIDQVSTDIHNGVQDAIASKAAEAVKSKLQEAPAIPVIAIPPNRRADDK